MTETTIRKKKYILNNYGQSRTVTLIIGKKNCQKRTIYKRYIIIIIIIYVYAFNSSLLYNILNNYGIRV